MVWLTCALRYASIVCAALMALPAALRAEDAPDDADRSGLGAVSEQIRRLLPMAVRDNRLVLDQDAWKRNSDTPEQRRANMAERLAKRMHIAPDKVPAHMIDSMLNSVSGLPAVDAFQSIMEEAGGGSTGGSSSQGGASFSYTSEARNMDGAMSINSTTHEFALKFVEKIGSRRLVALSDDKHMGLSIHFANNAKEFGFVFVQSPHGPAVLSAYRGMKTASLGGQNFLEMLRKDPKTMMEFFVEPLMEVGLDLPFSKTHPAVMSMVANGFNASTDAELKKTVEAAAKALEDDEQDVREKGQKDLTALFPNAIFEIAQLRDAAQDPEVKKRLSNVIDAYPDLQLAREYILIEKLHENRAYLIELLKNEKYKTGARTRLAALVGKDYGDDPAAWLGK